MLKRLICTMLAALLLAVPALAEDTVNRVFMEGETEPFPEDAELLTLWVCPLLGADCMLLTLGEHSMLVDAGRKVQAKQILEVMEEAGVSSVEYGYNSHPHFDHIGGVIPLLEAGFGFDSFITLFPHDYFEDPLDYRYQEDALTALTRAGVPIVDMDSGDKIPFGGADITILRTVPEEMDRAPTGNDLSGMLMVKYGSCSLLLAADVELYDELILTDHYDLKADILKYPHHGMSVLAREFLDEIDPEFIVFTHGAGDTKRAQAQMVDSGYDRMAFATWGVIRIQTDGTKWIVRQEILPEYQEIAKRYVYGK